MKLDNLHLGLALADAASAMTDQPELQTARFKLADYVLTHPISKVYQSIILRELGIHPDSVPSELWGDDVTDEATGATYLKAGIQNLNDQWHGGKLHRLIAVRNLAWLATQLARRLESDINTDAARVVARNGGSTAGLLHGFIDKPATRVELDSTFERLDSK